MVALRAEWSEVGRIRFALWCCRDWRVAVVDAVNRKVLKWIDLRPSGVAAGLRPIGVKVSPLNTAIYPRPYAVVLNQYGNFASVIDTGTDTVIGDFQTGTYAETHGKTSHLSASDIDALVMYLKSLDRANKGATTVSPNDSASAD